MNGVQCPICLEQARVPVRFTCFPCTREKRLMNTRPSCNSITRVCLLCAREYLQLNTTRNDRVPTRKCLLCSSTCHPSRLNASSAYEKDYLLMELDPSTLTCHRCSFVGTHHELDEHYSRSCPERMEYCFPCRNYFKHNDNDHKDICPNYIFCDSCGDYFHADKFEMHVQRAHEKQFCLTCNQWFDLVDDHASATCPYRFVRCSLCYTTIFYQDRQDHFDAHTRGYERIVQDTRSVLTHLEQKLLEWRQRPLETVFVAGEDVTIA